MTARWTARSGYAMQRWRHLTTPVVQLRSTTASFSSSSPIASSSRPDPTEDDQEPTTWRAHREAMKARFPDGWNPPTKLSRPSLALLRSLHASDPNTFTTPFLAEKFRVSPEAVRRILKSKWRMDEGKERELTRKWDELDAEKREETRRRKERKAYFKGGAVAGRYSERGSSASITLRRRAPGAQRREPETERYGSGIGAAVAEPPPGRVMVRGSGRPFKARVKGPFAGAKLRGSPSRSGSAGSAEE